MSLTRFGHEAILMNDGRIFVVSGNFQFFFSEIYTPSTDQWTPTADPDYHFTALGSRAVSISSSEILVTLFDSIQIYHVDRDQWLPAASMTELRSGPELTQLPDGHFLTVGGQGYIDYVSSFYQEPKEILSCEIYHPTTGKWSFGSALNVAKYQHTLHRVGDRLIAIGSPTIETLLLR